MAVQHNKWSYFNHGSKEYRVGLVDSGYTYSNFRIEEKVGTRRKYFLFGEEVGIFKNIGFDDENFFPGDAFRRKKFYDSKWVLDKAIEAINKKNSEKEKTHDYEIGNQEEKFIEEHIINMMYPITDEYQEHSEDDILKFSDTVMFFKNIKLTNQSELDNFSDRILKISKILNKKFSIETRIEIRFVNFDFFPLQIPSRILSGNYKGDYLSNYLRGTLSQSPILMDIYFEK